MSSDSTDGDRFDEIEDEVLREYARIVDEIGDMEVYVGGNGPINPFELEPADDSEVER